MTVFIISNLIFVTLWMIYNKPLGNFNFSCASSFQVVKISFYDEQRKSARPLIIFPYDETDKEETIKRNNAFSVNIHWKVHGYTESMC